MGVFDQKKKQTEWQKAFGWKGKSEEAMIKVQLHQDFSQPELLLFLKTFRKL